MVKPLIYCTLLLLCLDISKAPTFKVITTSTPKGIPPSSMLPTSTPSITTLLTKPSTTNPFYLEREYYLLLVNCTSKCRRVESKGVDNEKQIKEEITSISGTEPTNVNVQLAENNLVVIKCFMEYKNDKSKLDFRSWLNSSQPSISLIGGNDTADSPIQSSYLKSGLAICNGDEKCSDNNCQYKDFSSDKCFCHLYYNETCKTWDRNLLWLLIIPIVLLIILILLLIYCCKKNRGNNFDPGSKKDRYLQTYDDVRFENSVNKKVENNKKVEKNDDSLSNGNEGIISDRNDEEYNNVINNPTFIGNEDGM